MIYIKNDSFDPKFNLALEEYVLKNFHNDTYFLLWQDNPTVVVGRNQNTIEEVNLDYAYQNSINIVRRLSGGGAVYHDHGNLNFTFIVKDDSHKDKDFKTFTIPVIMALEKLGVKADFTGRNDITINGMKFSGNAQYHYKGYVLHHGTILYNSDLNIVANVLNVKKEKIESKGIKSIKSRVTNVYEHLQNKIDIDTFKEFLKSYIFEYSNLHYKQHILTSTDINNINEIMKSRYDTWEWTYGSSPAFTVRNTVKLPCGLFDLRINVLNGTIDNFRLYGDYFGIEDISELEEAFKGRRYDIDEIEDVVKSLDLSSYVSGITVDEFIDIIINKQPL